MKKSLAMVAAIAALGAAAPAMAQPVGWYAGAGYTGYDSDAGDIGAVTGRLGYQLTPNWGVEGEGSFGVDDDDGAELDNAFGVYGTGTLPMTDKFDLFGRVGYQTVEFSGAGDDSEDGLAYGGGVTWHVTPRFGVRGEYTRLEADEGIDTWGLGGVVSF